MENNKRCAIFPSSSFSGTKINGRRNFSRFSQYSRFDNRIFAIFRLFVWASVWLCPCFFRSALAEWDSGDSTTLGQIYTLVSAIKDSSYRSQVAVQSIDAGIVASNEYLRKLEQYGRYSSNGFGYDGTSSTGTLKQDVNSLILSLAEIHDNITVLQDGITELELVNQKLDSILDYLEGAGSGGGSSSLPTDIATETTLSAFKAQNHTDITAFQNKYEEISNQFLTSLGYTGDVPGGNGSLYNDFYTLLYPGGKYGDIFRYYGYFDSSLGDTSPYPNSAVSWGEMQMKAGYLRTSNNYMSIFAQLMAENTKGIGDAIIGTSKKSSWNDWYAHTNSLVRLDMIIDSLNSTPDALVDGTDDIGTFDESQLNITFDKATGDSSETIDLHPSFTNDVAELTAPVEIATNKVANLISYSKLSNRYKIPNVDVTNYRDYEITQDIPDYNLQYGTRPQMAFKFTSTSRNLFRGFLSRERMATLRSIFLKLWAFLAIYCNFLIFKIFGKMGGNE